MNDADRKFYAERLESLWGSYVAFVNFMITISGGTVLILTAKLVELRIEKRTLSHIPGQIWISFLLAAICTIYSIIWRALAQRYMEYEILAPFPDISEYMGKAKPNHCVTNPRRFAATNGVWFRSLYKLAPWIIGFGLFLSWVFIGLHLLTLLA